MVSNRLLTAIVVVCLLQAAGCDWLVSADKRVERAERQIGFGNDRAAFIELRKAVAQEPERIDAWLKLVDVSLRLGDPKGAERDLQSAISHGATVDQTARRSAEVLLAEGEAQQLLERIDSGDSALQEPALSTYRGLALLRTGQPAEAVKVLRDVLALDAQSSRASVVLAEALSASGESQAALVVLNDALQANAKDASALLLKGHILLRAGDHAAAAQSLSEARRNAAGQLSLQQLAAVLAALTEAHLGSGALERAEAFHAELVKLAPEAPITRLLAARIAMSKQDYASAVAEAHKALAADPGLLQAKLLLGVALSAQGNLQQAEVQLSELVQLAPENIQARKLLAQVNLQLQRPDVAAQVLAPIAQSNADDPQLSALLGVTKLRRGEIATGLEMLQRSVARQPDNIGLKHDLALAYLAVDRREEAIEVLESMPAGSAHRESLLISALASAGDSAAARAQVDQIVAANPGDITVLNTAARFYAGVADFDAARSVVKRALQIDPRSLTTFATLAGVESAAGRSDDALDAALRAAEIDPANQAAQLLVAELASRKGDVRLAIEHLEEVRAKNREAVQARVVLARAYVQQRNMKEADVLLEEVMPHAEGNPAVANALGELYLDSGRFHEALRWFRDAARQDSDPTWLLNVARAQLALGDAQVARETLQRLSAAHPDSVPVAAQLIQLDLRENQREAANARLARMRSVHPQDPRLAAIQGDIFMSSKSYASAAAAYEAAAKLAPSSAIALRMYQARRLGKLANPTQSLTEWLERSPHDVSVRLVLAEHYQASGNVDRAIEEYEGIVRSESPSPMALNNLAWIYHQRGEERALGLAKSAYEAAPGAAAIADTYGWILIERGQITEGLPVLEKAAAASSQPDIRYHYAVALAKAGQTDAARQELSELVRTNGHYPGAKDAQKLLRELGGS